MKQRSCNLTPLTEYIYVRWIVDQFSEFEEYRKRRGINQLKI